MQAETSPFQHISAQNTCPQGHINPHPRKARHWRPFDWTSPVGFLGSFGLGGSHLGGLGWTNDWNVPKLWMTCVLLMRLSNGGYGFQIQRNRKKLRLQVWVRKLHKVPAISPPSRWLDGKRSYSHCSCIESGRHFRGS